MHPSLDILSKITGSKALCRHHHFGRRTKMQSISSLQLELEIGKMARVMMTRNSEIGKDIISHFRSQFTTEAIAYLMIVSLERLIWFDKDSVFWSIEHLIPTDIMQEIKSFTTVFCYKQLIGKGFMPGKDFSIDADSNLLLNAQARKAISRR